MKCYAVFSEGVNIYKDQRVFKTKRSAQRNLESFIACTIGHDAQIKEVEKPSYFELEQEIQKLKADISERDELLEQVGFNYDGVNYKYEYEKLKADREELEKEQVRHIELLREEYAKLIQKLEEQNKLLIEALSYYACPQNWDQTDTAYWLDMNVFSPEEDEEFIMGSGHKAGKRAREALEKIKEMK